VAFAYVAAVATAAAVDFAFIIAVFASCAGSVFAFVFASCCCCAFWV